ncbi:hypothetical protein IT396_01550 [Candidatus Nomurabacteria bacterium]|nr:hypothetical protein [Candidatus Nomurabacteria bacterium]
MHTFKDNVLRIVAVLGLIVVLLLGAWGIIQLAFWLPSLVGNVTGSIGGIFKGEPAKEAVTLSLPAQTTSGDAFTLSWASRNASGSRTYGLAYQCKEGVSFEVTLPGKAAQKVACDTPFKLDGATSSVRITPTLAGTTATPIGVSVAATDSTGAITATSTGGTTVAAAKTTTTTPKPATSTAKPASTYYPSGRTQNLYGYSDLQVGINSAYVSSGRAAIQFTVQNIGTNVAPANWFFTANLPIDGGYTYQSPTQQALYPGDRIVFTMGYQATGNWTNSYCPPSYYGPNASYVAPCHSSYNVYNYDYGSQSVTIHVDPYNIVPEMNEVNNTASRSFY